MCHRSDGRQPPAPQSRMLSEFNGLICDMAFVVGESADARHVDFGDVAVGFAQQAYTTDAELGRHTALWQSRMALASGA